MLDFLNQYANLILAILTFLYLLATIVYVVLTHSILRESRLTRLASNQPRLLGRLEPYSGLAVRYVITNVGIGAAVNIELHMQIDEDQSSWKHKVFEANRTEYFFLPHKVNTINEMESVGHSLVVTLKYDDAFGNHESVAETLNLKDIAAGWRASRWQIIDTDVLRAAKQISEAIDKLAKR